MSDIDSLLNKTVDLITVTETLNDRGDVDKAYSTVSTSAEIQVLNGDEREVRAGILEPGDAIGFFGTGETVEIGDEVSYQGNRWIVVGKFTETLNETEEFIEVHLKKKVE